MPRHEPSYNPAVRVVLLEGQFHPRSALVSAAAKALVRGIWLQPDGVAQASPRRPLFLAYLLSSYQRHAAACASRPSAFPRAWPRREQFASRPGWQIQAAVCWAGDSARRSSGPARTARRAPSRESEARSRRTPAAAPATCTSRLPDGTQWNRPEGGMCMWLELPPGFDASELLIHVKERGVLFAPGRYFYVQSPLPNTLRLG